MTANNRATWGAAAAPRLAALLIGILVGALLASGLLVPMAALIVDVGTTGPGPSWGDAGTPTAMSVAGLAVAVLSVGAFLAESLYAALRAAARG